MLEFFDCEISADSYKVRLLLDILQVERKTRLVEFYPIREHRSDWFLEINPRGELPVIRDNDIIIEDAQTILVHIARKYDMNHTWYPARDRTLVAPIATWLSFADALTATAGAARLHDGLLYDHIDIDQCRADANDLLRLLDEHLWFAEQQDNAWLCPRSEPTVADIACFPDVMLAEEGGVSLQPYRAIRRWTDRIKAIPGFVAMAGMFPP